MKNGKCPKCGSMEIVALKVPNASNTANGNIMMEHIPLGFFKGARLQHYVCKNCGCLEHYVIEKDIKNLP